MNNDTYITCNHCGRSFVTTGEPKCNYCNSCMQEYTCTKPACIRNKKPDCEAAAVIPSTTVETVDGITNLANCFVHVSNINTTFYIDDKHRIMITWAGAVEVENYDYENNPLGLRSQDCYTTINNVYAHIRFDKQGVAHIMETEA